MRIFAGEDIMDMSPEKKKKITKWVIGVVAACIVIFLCLQNIAVIANAFSWCVGITLPLMLGCAIALIVNVPMRFFEAHLWAESKKEFMCKARRPVAFILSLVFVIGILAGVVAVVIPELVDTITVIVQYAVKLVSELNAMDETELAEMPFGRVLMDVDWNKLLESLKSWLTEQADFIVNAVFGTLTSLVSGIFDLFVSVVFAIYILFGKDKLKKQAQRIVRVWLPENVSEWSCHAASVANANFRNFVSGQFLEAVILGVLCFVGMLIFRFPYAAMISTLVGVTALVPVVGGFIGGGIGAFMILTIDPMKAVLFIVYLVVLQQLEGNLIYPRVMGSRVNLPGMWILAAVTVGGGVGGPLGMLLSVPIASTAYILFKEATCKREKLLSKNK